MGFKIHMPGRKAKKDNGYKFDPKHPSKAKDGKNWKFLDKKDEHTTIQNRDVYEDQQLERSTISKKQSPIGRIILVAFISIFASIIIWLLLSVMQFGIGAATNNINSAKESTKTEQTTTIDNIKVAKPVGGNKYAHMYLTSKYIVEMPDGRGGNEYHYITDPETGVISTESYAHYKDVPEPEWYKALKHTNSTSTTETSGENAQESNPLFACLGFDWYKLIIDVVLTAIVFGLFCTIMMRNLAAQNLMSDTTDINQYQNDQHIALPEEVMRKFDFFPDAGAHSSVSVSSMISHMMILNKGIKKVNQSVRAKEDTYDKDNNLIALKGDLMFDEDDKLIQEKKTMFDTKFADELFDASGALADKSIRKFYDARTVPYNEGNKNRDKLKGCNTLADLINNDWTFPYYETQRPAGVYAVDTEPVNTMV